MRPTNVAEFDLVFVRDIKHRLRMILREIEKVERWMMKDRKQRQGEPSLAQIEAAIDFYSTLKLKRQREKEIRP
jgi:hypothetical protein